MQIIDTIKTRRSIKKFDSRPVTRAEFETLLDAAVYAPNHHLTQPWRFYVLGPDARYAYGLALGNRKAKKIENPDAAQVMRENVANEHRMLPGMLVVAIINNDNPEIREEDYASAMMAIQNLSLVATSIGLGTHIKTGAVMADPVARAAARVHDNERIVAIVNVGVPLETPAAKQRTAATDFTTWLD